MVDRCHSKLNKQSAHVLSDLSFIYSLDHCAPRLTVSGVLVRSRRDRVQPGRSISIVPYCWEIGHSSNFAWIVIICTDSIVIEFWWYIAIGITTLTKIQQNSMKILKSWRTAIVYACMRRPGIVIETKEVYISIVVGVCKFCLSRETYLKKKAKAIKSYLIKDNHKQLQLHLSTTAPVLTLWSNRLFREETECELG